jgi:hypothetical protein
MSVREFSCSRGNNPKALEQVFERQEIKMQNVLDDFMAFSEKLIDNGILLDVKDVIALFKMLKEGN